MTYENYIINEDGTIFNKKKMDFVKMKIDSVGYVTCCLDGKKVRLHRILATRFLKKEKWHREVNHIDGNRTNNNISNLEWCTSSENNTHAHKNIKRKSVKKLSFEEIEYIKTCGKTGKELSLKFGMSSQHMNALKRGKFQVEFTEKRDSK